jgi:uncharacterized protein with HEPN domain
MRSDETLLLDMLIAARRIQEFSTDLTADSFQKSKLHQSAIIREIQVIGEAARQISEATRNKHSRIKWAEIAGMRNRLIHEYFRIEIELLWDAVQRDIPELIDQLESLVPPNTDER